MSWQYGWNAQSALLPQEKKYIKVSDKGLDKLKLQIQSLKSKSQQQENKEKDILKRIKQAKQIKQNKQIKEGKQIKKNKGIQQRIRKDQAINKFQNTNNKQSWQTIQKHLIKKQQIYNQMQNKIKNHSQFLVDFQQKNLSLSKQDQQFEQLKINFYAGRLNQIIKQQQQLNQREQKNIEQYRRQNLFWQRQILEELKGDLIVEKQKVAQSFDRKLTEQQKKALEKIVQDKIKQKQRLKSLQQKKQEEKLAKLRKLQKFDLINN